MGVSTFLDGDQACPEQGRRVTVKNEADAGSSKKLLAIRPEHICIGKEAGVNALAGQVMDCVFRGEYIEYQVDVNDVTVRARMPMPAPMFPHGARVYVDFPQEHLFEVES